MKLLSALVAFLILSAPQALGQKKPRQRQPNHSEIVGSEGGNGATRVGLLFRRAKEDAIRISEGLRVADVPNLDLQWHVKEWLLHSDGVRARLQILQVYVKKMRLVPIEGPCIERDTGLPRPTCYDDSDPEDPKMIYSHSENRHTTSAEAIGMVFHEAGHFARERNHNILDDVGYDLAKLNRSLTRDVLTAAQRVHFRDGDSRQWRLLCTPDGSIDEWYPGGQAGENDRRGNAFVRRQALAELNDDVLERCRSHGAACSDIVVRVYPLEYSSGVHCAFLAYPRQFERLP